MPLEDIENRSKIGAENKDGSKTPMLVGQQLDYLSRGEVGSNNQSALEKKIKFKKLPLLSARFQHLIEDVALFQTANFIEQEQWESVWDQVAESASQNSVFDSEYGVSGLEEAEEPYYEFGIQLGHLARLLAKNGASEFRDKEISFGFLIGLAGHFMNADLEPHTSDQHSNESFNILSGPSAQTSRFMDRVMEAVEAAEESGGSDLPQDRYAKEAIKKVGLEPVPPLQEELIDRTTDHMESLFPSIPQPSADHLSNDSGPFPSEDQFLDRASDLKSDRRIYQAHQLAECISTEMDLLSNAVAKKQVAASEVFYVVCSTHKPSRKDIRDGVDDLWMAQEKAKKHNTNIARNYILGNNSDYNRWEKYPLAKESSNGTALTAYGRLVGIIFTPDAIDRDTNKHLPEPKNGEAFSFPSKEQILTACYACALGKPSESHKDIFEEAYRERINNKFLHARQSTLWV